MATAGFDGHCMAALVNWTKDFNLHACCLSCAGHFQMQDRVAPFQQRSQHAGAVMQPTRPPAIPTVPMRQALDHASTHVCTPSTQQPPQSAHQCAQLQKHAPEPLDLAAVLAAARPAQTSAFLLVSTETSAEVSCRQETKIHPEHACQSRVPCRSSSLPAHD